MTTITEASRLLGIALNPKARPGNTGAPGEYRKLLARYLEESEFAETVRAIAEGWGLEILHADPMLGLMFSVMAESPFRATASNYLVGMVPWERAVYGLITLAVAAQFFPNPTDIERPHEPLVTVAQINQYLSHLAEVVCAQHEAEPLQTDERLWRVCVHVKRLADTKQNERAGSKTREGMIDKALSEMERAALVRADDNERGAWIATTRLRLRLRLGIGNDLIALIRSAAAAPDPR